MTTAEMILLIIILAGCDLGEGWLMSGSRPDLDWVLICVLAQR